MEREYAIELCLSDLRLTPDDLEIHKALRKISVERSDGCGKPLGMFETMKLHRAVASEVETLLNFEKLLAYNPDDREILAAFVASARHAGFHEVARWAEGLD